MPRACTWSGYGPFCKALRAYPLREYSKGRECVCRAGGLWSRHKRLESSSEGPAKYGEDRPSAVQLTCKGPRTELKMN